MWKPHRSCNARLTAFSAKLPACKVQNPAHFDSATQQTSQKERDPRLRAVGPVGCLSCDLLLYLYVLSQDDID